MPLALLDFPPGRRRCRHAVPLVMVERNSVPSMVLRAVTARTLLASCSSVETNFYESATLTQGVDDGLQMNNDN